MFAGKILKFGEKRNKDYFQELLTTVWLRYKGDV